MSSNWQKFTPDEFKTYITDLKVSRSIKLVQLHHTWDPSYDEFNGSNHTDLQERMKNFHINDRGFADIAQHFTIFPDGIIMTGRSIESDPAGIYGANTGAICIENVGDFDEGKDSMRSEQKAAIVSAVTTLLKKFGLSTSSGVTYHAWWTSGGTSLGTYVKGKSYKTCPGTNFFGGNTREAYESNLMPLLSGGADISLSSNAWLWPVLESKTVTSNFGYRIHPISKKEDYHTGIDISASTNGVDGDTIIAAHKGKVIKATDSGGGYGNEIQIEHEGGIISQYAHNSELLVSNGSEVEAGTAIARMGNTGTSTNTHLHFGIKVGTNWVDPLLYVSPDNSTLLNSLNSESIQSSPYSVDASGVTAGQRVSGLTSQPIHAYFSIYIKVGDELRLLATTPPKPNVYQNFEYNRLEDSGETATFTLFDDNWEEIEKALHINFNDIYIEYGYPGTGLKSDMIKHKITNYSISFESTGAILSVSSVTEGAYNNLKPRTIALETYNPTEAVKKICKDLGYTVLDENFDASQDVSANNPFNMIEEYPITYIQNVIIPQASKEGEELFSFDVDSEGVAYFKKSSYYNTTKTDRARTYIYQKGYDSPIISIEFDIKGVFSGASSLSLATGYRSVNIDSDSKEQQSTNADKSTVVTEASGDTLLTSIDQSNPLIDSAGYTASQMSSKLYYDMKVMHVAEAAKCTMTIVGDPTIKLLEYVRLINVTDSGSLHHTSGVYQVMKITDTISGGTMTTALEMSRRAMYNIDGLEIINPKTLIK